MPCTRVLVITSCTGEKRFKPENQLTLADFRNPERLHEREVALANYACSAGEMYTGMQHLRLMEGVQLLRQSYGQDAIDLMILSAGYGLIAEQREIAPYEVTFNAMKGYEVDAWAQSLGIHSSFEQAIQNYDLVFVLLGENYLRSLSLPVATRSDQTIVFFASQAGTQSIYGLAAKTFVVKLSNAEAKHYRYGLVGLKGFLFKRFAEAAIEKPDLFSLVYDNPEIIYQVIEGENQLELSLGIEKIEKIEAQTQPKKLQREEFVPIPDLPMAPNVHLGMQYYIPEWDDRVDPNFDFLTDTQEKKDPYLRDKYAHELYDTPNYDGILVSKIVIDASARKRQQIEAAGGIHQFLRFEKAHDFSKNGETSHFNLLWQPVMGDCGAFGYIKEDLPPYNTDEILQYYEQFGFTYGVSIDHLIVGPFAKAGIREQRYDLTLKNSEDFIVKHQARGYRFTPIGVAQGWNPERYAEAVKDLIRMGYKYIALGGLARAKDEEILEVLKAVHPNLVADVRMHLFGVARISSIPAFRHLGVTSCDSATYLRQAWLSADANYHTPSGIRYAAIRIPPVQGYSVRIQQVLKAGIADLETLTKLESQALKALRQFDVGERSLKDTLHAVLAYDELMELPRDNEGVDEAQARRRLKHERLYRVLLEAQPWKACDCPMCHKHGVEVVIFRKNNRNRRRGFHNTYVFYKRFKALLEQLTALKPEEQSQSKMKELYKNLHSVLAESTDLQRL